MLGALGDWVSTTLGLRIGLLEGNMLAASLMKTGSWITVDLVVVGICVLVPYLVNRVVKSRSAKMLYVFPLLAGLFKLAVSLWNINLII
jgi:uncharacterized membrane protein (UPF0136 family)